MKSAFKRYFSGRASRGRLRLEDPDRWRDFLRALEGARVDIIVTKSISPRTSQESRYLWNEVYARIAVWSGHSSERIHEALALKFLCAPLTLGEERMSARRSVAGLSLEEFSEYIERVQEWAASQGLEIPEMRRT